MNGYAGTILRVDLSQGKVWKEPLQADWARDFIGASGLAARYLYDMVEADTDPLGPENPLIWMTGLLTGTRTPSSTRSAFCARSPLTNIWGESNVGGFAGRALRDAGYDGVIVTGQAKTPVYLYIDGERAALRDAIPFWGLSTYECQTRIAQALGAPRVRVACIGPAGERLVRYASIMTGDGRAAGRAGMGTVMGSKRLKAIAVCGRAGKAPMADQERFKAAAARALDHVRDDMAAELLKTLGTSAGTEYFNMLGAVPARYWTLGDFEEISNLSGAELLETLRVGSGGCQGCWVQCGPRIEIPEAPYKLPPVAGPEYETMLSLGSQLLIGDLEPVSYCGYLCDALGMDTLSTGAAIGLAFYLYDQGLISLEETGGLELYWGNDAVVAQLIPMIARRAGLGDLLADGVRAVERRFDAPGTAVHVNGLSPAMHDPRGIPAMALVYLTSPRGACHNKSDFYMIASGHYMPEIGVELDDPKAADEAAAREVVWHQNWRSFVDSSGSCQLTNSPFDALVEMVNAATGRQETVESLSRTGERILTLKRLINLKFGLTRADEVLPRLLTEPLVEGNAAGFVPDAELMLNVYYQEHDWDIETGRPSQARLEALGLGDLL
jgi:aldehyde:ferredoxin oxidoreductase